MAPPWSQTRRPDGFGPATGATASPSRRRVTRSQSRELGEVPASQSHDNLKGPALRGGQKQRGQSKVLPPVVEESPVRSPQKQGFRYGNSVIPESPEDVGNISGTTILPSEPETDLEPEMMLEALPDLERASKNVLDFLVPNSSDPLSIINAAKRLGDPQNTQNRRLRRLISNLSGEARYFGNQSYIDAERVGHIFSSALANRNRGLQKQWSSSPILHLANCAHFAFEILLAGVGNNSQKQAIKNIESLFPLPFMDDLNADKLNKSTGESSLAKDTFDLALEIRTQSLIMLLEDHEKDGDFEAMPVVRTSFFEGLSVDSPLRGFNLKGLGGTDGVLPIAYQDSVQERFNEIQLSLTGNGSIDIDELKGAYRWQRFVFRAAQWVRKRTEEIGRDLREQMSAQDVHDAFFDAKPPSFDSAVGGSDADPELSPVIEESEQETTAAPDHQNDARPTHSEKERRRSSKPSFLNSSAIQRITQRQERLRSGTDDPDNRRQSDFVRSNPERVSEESESNTRRQTLPALPTSTQREEPRDNLPSPDASATLLHDELDIYIGDDSNLTIGENEGNQLEKSHSPPVIRRRTPQLHQNNRSTDPADALSREMLRAIKTGVPERFASAASGSSRAAFIDRQPNAERVSPISQEAHVSRKRARNAVEGESGGEDDFRTLDRPVDIVRRRAEKPDQRRNKRQRLQAEEEEESTQDEDLDRSARPTPQPSSQPRQTGWVSTNAARESVASIRSSQAQMRWTAAEDQRLVRLIEEFGCGWAQISRQNEAQPERTGETRIEGRNQVQLKDRARNLKIKFLREQQPLPQNFEGVTMKKKDYDMLAKKGIEVPSHETRPARS